MSNLTELVLRRKQGVVFNETNNVENKLTEAQMLTIMHKLSGFGYKLSEKAVDKLFINPTITEEDALKSFDSLFTELSNLLDAHEDYIVFYSNFPAEVMDISKEGRLVHQLLHYLIGYVPEQLEVEGELVETKAYDDLRELSLFSEDIYEDILKDMLVSTVAMSDSDKEDMIYLVNTFTDKKLEEILSSISIKNKETMGALVVFIIKNRPNFKGTSLIKIPRDMLRVMSILTNGEDQLSKNTRFRKFDKEELDFIFSTLDAMKGKEEDFKLKKYRNMWTAFFKYNKFSSKKYPTLDRYAKISFNKIKYTTFDNKLNKSIEDMKNKPTRKSVLDTVELLSQRAGIFARNLDTVLRSAVMVDKSTFNKVLVEFSKVAHTVDSKVLIQLRNRVLNVKNDVPRMVTIKGLYTSLEEKDTPIEFLKLYDVEKVISVIDNALMVIYSDKEDMGNVVLNPNLKNIVLSTSEKGKSKQLRPMFTGSRMTLGENTEVIRLFTTWKDGNYGRIDIDSSAVVYDENLEKIDSIFYGNYERTNGKYGVLHSGDMVKAPNGAVEYVDIDVEDALSKGVRYVLHDLNVYSGYTFEELQNSDCEPRSGAMSITRKQSENAFSIKGSDNRDIVEKRSKMFFEASVDVSFDLSNKTRTTQSILIDLKNLEYIWLDASVNNVRKVCGNVENNYIESNEVLNYLVNRESTTLYDLYQLHASVRGNIIESKEDLEEIISNEEDVTILEAPTLDTPLDTTDILANWI